MVAAGLGVFVPTQPATTPIQHQESAQSGDSPPLSTDLQLPTTPTPFKKGVVKSSWCKFKTLPDSPASPVSPHQRALTVP